MGDTRFRVNAHAFTGLAVDQRNEFDDELVEEIIEPLDTAFDLDRLEHLVVPLPGPQVSAQCLARRLTRRGHAALKSFKAALEQPPDVLGLDIGLTDNLVRTILHDGIARNRQYIPTTSPSHDHDACLVVTSSDPVHYAQAVDILIVFFVKAYVHERDGELHIIDEALCLGKILCDLDGFKAFPRCGAHILIAPLRIIFHDQEVLGDCQFPPRLSRCAPANYTTLSRCQEYV
jgi:hypothetical protein